MKKSQSTSEKSQLSRTLAVLNKIGKSLIDVQDPSKVLNQIAKDAKTVLGADIVDLYEYNQGRKEFVLPPVMVGKRLDLSVTKDRIYDDDVVMKVVKSGKPQYFADSQDTSLLTKAFDVSREDVPDERFVIREGVASSVSLPLKAGEETVGVMFINYRARQEFDGEQRTLIESFSNLAAIAIHNARLWTVEKEQDKLRENFFVDQSRQLDAIKEIVDAIGATSDPLPIILEQVVSLFAADYGAIGLFTSQTKEIQFYAIWEDGKLLTGDDIQVEKRNIRGEKSIMFHVATTGETYCASDVRMDPYYKKWYSKTRSELAVPLRDADKKVIGILDLESEILGAFTTTDEALCAGLAKVITAIIEKNNLLNNTGKLNRQLVLLHEIIGEQDLQKVLNRVLEGLNEIVGEGTSSSINLYDLTSNTLYSILAEGELANNLREPPRPDGTCRFVVGTKRPLYVDDAFYEMDHPPADRPTVRKEAVLDGGIRSFAALPLIHSGDVLGVLFIHQKNPMAFPEDIRLTLETFADRAAISIDSARRTLDVTALQDINDAITSKPLDEVLNLVAKKAAQVVGAEYCTLWWGELDSGDLLLRALYCPSGDVIKPLPDRIKFGTLSVNMAVFKTGISNLVPNVNKESKYHRIYLKGLSELAVPMKYGGKTIGTLNVESERSNAFSDHNAIILDSFADQAVIAIVSAQTYEQRAKDIAALQEINGAIGREPLENIHNLIAQKASDLTNAAYSTLWIVDVANACLKVGAVYGRDALEDTLPLNDKSINGQVALTRQPYRCNDTDKDTHYHSWYADIHSNLTVPILFRDQLIGTLHVESTQKAAYNESHEKLLQSLAAQAAIAIKLSLNMEEINKEIQEQNQEILKRTEELYHMNYRLERRNASFEALTEIGQQLTANVQYGEKQILSIIHEQASQIMDTGNMYIALYEPEKNLVYFELAFLDGKSVDIKNEKNWQPRSGGNGRTEWIIRNKTPILTYTKVDAVTWYEQPNAQNYIGQTFASWLGVPIKFGEEVLGVIATYNKTEEYKYDPDDLRILSLMGRQAAIALQNARLISKLDTVRELGEDLSSSLSI